ncbi:MAG: LysM peptidoglycan-binding domain-containing protein [Pleurocapsa minor GSE-CHR-MK-17-07R]|jgi:LysM repeat protein|nr:LysM peptidoglycan-binding domain-containing protein [Pleurocapsa minor GSE-CHR-MK 17-07R]
MLCLIVVLLASLAAAPVSAQNSLIDPSFEGNYSNRGRADFNIPDGWQIWFAESPRTESWMNLQPVAFPHNGPGPNPYEGARALNLNKGYATFTAAVYQQVNVAANSNLVGSAYAWLKTCNPAPNTPDCGSAVESGAYVRVGIDPNGGNNPYDTDIVWSANAFPHDRWQQVSVNATATGTTVTLFLFVTQAWPSQLNNVYFDAASLTGGGPGGAAAPSQPGVPAATLIPTPVPFASFVARQPPQPDGSTVHTVQGGDTLDAIAFAYGVSRQEILDLNGMARGSYLLVGDRLLIANAPEATATTAIQPTNTVAQVAQAATPRPTQAGMVISSGALSALRILSNGAVAYIVQASDTAQSIATVNNITVDELLALNEFESESELVVGEEIIVRAAPDGSTYPEGEGPLTAEEPVATAEVAPLDIAVPTVEASGLTPDSAPPAPIISITTGDVAPALDIANAPATICLSMFDDQNRNRLNEVTEPLLADGTILLIKDGEMFQTYTTTGDEPECFTDLPAGDYIASAISPAGYGLTTPEQLMVRPAPGWTINIAFGAGEGVQPPAAPTSTNTSDAGAATSLADAAKPDAVAKGPESPLQANASYIAFGLAAVVVIMGSGLTLAVRALGR